MADEDLPPSLQREASLISSTINREVGAISDAELLTTHDCRLPLPTTYPSRPIAYGDDVWQLWRALLQQCDYAWLVAPESENTLQKLTSLAQTTTCQVLGSPSSTIAKCANKYDFFQAAIAAAIPTIETRYAGDALPKSSNGWIVKPNLGAGCQFCHYFHDAEQLHRFVGLCDEPSFWLVQPYLAGKSISLSLLAYQGRASVLGCNRQDIICESGMLKAKGLRVNEFADMRAHFAKLANNIAATFPDLAGFVGVDLILQADNFRVVEVNPRITTAAAGLSRSLGVNICALIMDVFRRRRLPELSPLARSVYLNFGKLY